MTAARTNPPDRLPGLEGLRGIACLMVFLYHLRWHAQPSTSDPLQLRIGSFDFERLLASFDAGVAVFFVLSGLLLSLPYWRAILEGRPTPLITGYLWRRACRIVPAYFAVLFVVYLLRPGTYTLHGGIDFLLHATFLHTFSDTSYHGVYPLLWTIGIELQFYLLLPLIMAGIAWLWRRTGAWVTLLVLFAGTFGLDLVARATFSAAAPFVSDRFLRETESPVTTGSIFSYLKLFAFGIAGALAVLRFSFSRRTADVLAFVSALGFLLLLGAGSEGGWRDTALIGWPVNAAVIAVFAVSLTRSPHAQRFFCARPVVALGTVSYGVYLWHELIQRAVFGGTLPNQLQGFPLFVVGGIMAFAVTLAFAALSWRYIELPALRTPVPTRA